MSYFCISNSIDISYLEHLFHYIQKIITVLRKNSENIVKLRALMTLRSLTKLALTFDNHFQLQLAPYIHAQYQPILLAEKTISLPDRTIILSAQK